jgi:uncharacterized protein
MGGVASMTKPLSKSEAWKTIEAGKLGRLGCVDDGEPYVVPINFLVHDRQIYSHSLIGRKVRALREHARACLQVDKIDDDFHWRSAIAFGDFEEVVDPDERKQILQDLLTRFPKLTPVESQLQPDTHARPAIVFRLRVDRVTGVAED